MADPQKKVNNIEALPSSQNVNVGSMLLQNDSIIQSNEITQSRAVTENLFEIQDQALIESMSRSVLVRTGLWTPSDLPITTTITEEQLDSGTFKQSTLFEFDLPGALFSESPMLRGKFANIAYFTADCLVNLKVQGSPFLQGMLKLAQIPYAQGTSAERRTYNEHLRSLSTFPNTTLNLQNPSRSVDLHVPYVNEFQNINPNDVDGLSSVRCWVIAALDSAISGSYEIRASYAVTARLTNIRLYGTAPSVTTSTLTCVSPLRKVNVSPNSNRAVTRNNEVVCQDGEDETASKGGIISAVANTVADVADAASAVPSIASIAKPISWLARAGAGVASFFGFSKPSDLEKNSVYTNLPARGYNNALGIDQSVTLAVLPDNQINPTRSTFSDQDEMSIDYIAKRPYVLGVYDWKTTDNNKDILFEIPVHPSNFSTYGATLRDRQGLFTAPIGLVSRLAHYWRGQMSIKFEFAKTQFHQGRLLVQYLPYGRGVQGVETVNSHILDISQIDHEGHSIDFPTVIQNKWLKTDDNATSSYTEGASAGVIVVSVFNELVAASTVAENIQIIPNVHWNNFEIAEQTSNAKIAVSDSYSNRTLGSGSEYASQDGAIKFTTLTSQRVYFSGAVGYPTAAAGRITVQREGDTFIQSLVAWTEDSGTSLISVKPVDIGPGTYTVFNDGLNTDEYNIFLSGPASLVQGTFVRGVEVKLETTANIGDTYTTDYNGWIHCASFAKSWTTTVDPTDTCSVSNGLNGGTVVKYYNDIPRRWGVHPHVTQVGTTNTVDTQIDGTVWLVLRWTTTKSGGETPTKSSDEIVAQDFQEGDTSTKETTMGEIIPSLRLLTRRFTLYNQGQDASVLLGSSALNTPLSLRQSLLDVISFLYRFTAGSVRHKIITPDKKLLAVTMANTSLNVSGEGFTPLDINSATHIQDTSLNPIVEINIPFFSPAENLAIDSRTFSLSQVAAGTLDNTEFTYSVLKAAGDDHTFSFLVGCPAFVV